MSLLPLRPYQREAVATVETSWAAGMRRPAVLMPTGTGKTVVFAHLIADWQRRQPRRRRTLVVAHRHELLEQAAAKISAVAPDLQVGIVKAQRNETRAEVVVASVQTLRNENRRQMIADVGLVVVDECHHAAADTYVAILDHFGCLGDDARTETVGFTATMVRGDDRALGAVWQDVVYRMSISEAIHGGWLVRPRGTRVRIDDLDLSKVRRSRGDYSEGDLGRALTESLAPEVIAKAVLEHASERRSILFAPTVESGQVIAEAVRDAGLTVGMVTGAMSPTDRRRILGDFSAGQIGLMVNCMVLTEGYDDPATDCVVIARPTTNVGLYIQMVGRALRPYPGKSDALVLDVVGASQRHALASPVDLFGDDPKERERVEAELEGVESDDLDDGELVADYLIGPTVSEDVDLFHGSVMQWLRTDGGIWFLPAGDRYVAIVPAERPLHYDVVAMFKKRSDGPARWVIQNVADRAYAMAWAEGEVTPRELTTAKRERGWRRQEPTTPQKALANRLRVAWIPGLTTCGELSSMIEVKLATARIDPPTYDLLKRYGRVS